MHAMTPNSHSLVLDAFLLLFTRPGLARRIVVEIVEQPVKVAATSVANKICIVRGRANRDALGGAAEEITKAMSLRDFVNSMYPTRLKCREKLTKV